MKLKKELWDEDQKVYIEKRIDPIVSAFRAGTVDGPGGEGMDKSQKITKKEKLPDMFRKKPGKP